MDMSAINAEDLNPSAIQKLLNSAMPSLQNLLFNIVISIVIYLVGKKVISFLLRILEKFMTRSSIDVGAAKFLLSLAKTLLYVILIFMIVAQLGINTASIVTVLGAAGLAVSMSLQGSLSNLAGGILILMMKPFRVGDYVMTSYGDGVVQSIGMVYTTITTLDNRVLTVPNGTLSNSSVMDASMMKHRRLDIEVGISYDSDLRKAKKIMEEVYRSCPSIVADKEIDVHVSSLSDSAVMIEGFGWVPGPEYLRSKWYVTENVKLRFDEGGIKIPYPQMDVHLDTSEEGVMLTGRTGKS